MGLGKAEVIWLFWARNRNDQGQPLLTHSTLFKARQPRVYAATRIYRRPHTTKGPPIRLRRRNASMAPNETSRAAPRRPKGQRARGPCAAAAKTAQRLAED